MSKRGRKQLASAQEDQPQGPSAPSNRGRKKQYDSYSSAAALAVGGPSAKPSDFLMLEDEEQAGIMLELSEVMKSHQPEIITFKNKQWTQQQPASQQQMQPNQETTPSFSKKKQYTKNAKQIIAMENYDSLPPEIGTCMSGLFFFFFFFFFLEYKD